MPCMCKKDTPPAQMPVLGKGRAAGSTSSLVAVIAGRWAGRFIINHRLQKSTGLLAPLLNTFTLR